MVRAAIPCAWLRAPVALIVVAVALPLAGCGGSRGGTGPQSARTPAKPPPLARVVPAGYHTLHVYRARLAGGRVREVVVTSAGPPTGNLGFHPADLQVLSWDTLARRWTTIFDAEKVQQPDVPASPLTSNAGPGIPAGVSTEPHAPILDPKADVHIDRVRFASLLSGKGQQLVFSATSSLGGSGGSAILAVVEVSHGVADVAYVWTGEGLYPWRVDGRRIVARASYWTPADPHCCPSRTYRFVLAARRGFVQEVQDQRPYLGVLVRTATDSGSFTSPLRVLEVAPGAPAAGSLRVGDLILGVANAPPPARRGDPEVDGSIFDKLVRFDAGQTAQLVVERGSARLTVPVELGSLRDAAGGLSLPANDYTVAAL